MLHQVEHRPAEGIRMADDLAEALEALEVEPDPTVAHRSNNFWAVPSRKLHRSASSRGHAARRARK
jgi:hypothetical protein